MEHPSLKNLTTHYAEPGEKQSEFLVSYGKPHLDSFNHMIHYGLNEAVRNIQAANFVAGNQEISMKIENVIILPSLVPPGIETRNKNIWPSECRQRGCTYNGRLIVDISLSINNSVMAPIKYDLGRVPIMIKSDLCHLKGLSPKELIKNNEHPEEWGGYFVVKGSEKIIRMLLLTRRNFPIAVDRSSWKLRGNNFSSIGIIMRCVQTDETSTNNVLHFITDGSAKLMINYGRSLFYLPILLILKCLINSSDEHILKSITTGYEDDFFMAGSVVSMLVTLQKHNIVTQKDARCYIGKTLRLRMNEFPANMSDDEVCDFIVRNCICIHINNFRDKFNCLVLMVQKLYCVIQGKCLVEGVDSVMMQELLLGGNLYQQVIKDRLKSWFSYLKTSIIKDSEQVDFSLTRGYLEKAMKKCGSVGRAVEYFLSSGNISNTVSAGAQQTKGLVIIAENINRMRYMSHFKAVHRGSYFQEMRTTEVRQLMPDAWGFICPVHTPDGAPCGLLNHLSKSVQVTEMPDKKLVCKLPETLVSLGMQPLCTIAGVPIKESYPVMLDGCLIGYLPHDSAQRLVNKLRILKVNGEKVPNTLEIVLMPKKESVCQFPGLFLFTSPARMMRPVFNLAAQQVELIGTLEQVYLDICITPEEAYEGITTHQELSKDNFLSNLACLIPMPDFNQSPRNMYQCQMGKQTMGTPCHTWHLQAETKLYRLQTPASPLFRPVHYDNIEMDNFAMGVNAIVAVVSYTGYDMEDAMIINKSSFERGFAHGSILKSEFVELEADTSYFGLDPERPELQDYLGSDGLPSPGSKLTKDVPMCCYFDGRDEKFVVVNYKEKTEAIVDNVRICGYLDNHQNSKQLDKACITYRVPRNPSVGDKFASRAGQKGICSYLWQAEDLPFTETGLVPDIVFNPHGFPSRMTIAMIVEFMAGKSAALHGLVHDASPFKFSEKDTAIDYFGKMLQAGGYNYYGTERMYSGLNGYEMAVDIFFGIVHYQRLRHMVFDKWQVRSTGAVDVVTRQPVKGRKRGGGVRFGEMERDSLLSHGASFLLQDRLFNCSDKSMTLVCRSCGSTLSPVTVISNQKDENKSKSRNKFSFKCKICEDGGQIENMPIPHIFKYLSAQLASVNINLKMDISSSYVHL